MDQIEKPVVLIVDDEESFRDLLADIVEECGFLPLPAENGQEALNLLDLGNIAAIVSDLIMPNIDGLKLLEMVKQKKPTLPFIVLTGHWTKDSSLTALRLGAFDFIEKPFTLPCIQDVIKKAVLLHKAQESALAMLLTKFGKLTKNAGKDDLRGLEVLADLMAKRKIAS